MENLQIQERHNARWASVYAELQLERSGIALDDFLAAPWKVLVENGHEASMQLRARGFRPLLPAQARIARKIREMEQRENDIQATRQRHPDILAFPIHKRPN